jgi:hypothetical protein
MPKVESVARDAAMASRRSGRERKSQGESPGTTIWGCGGLRPVAALSSGPGDCSRHPVRTCQISRARHRLVSRGWPGHASVASDRTPGPSRGGPSSRRTVPGPRGSSRLGPHVQQVLEAVEGRRADDDRTGVHHRQLDGFDARDEGVVRSQLEEPAVAASDVDVARSRYGDEERRGGADESRECDRCLGPVRERLSRRSAS